MEEHGMEQPLSATYREDGYVVIKSVSGNFSFLVKSNSTTYFFLCRLRKAVNEAIAKIELKELSL